MKNEPNMVISWYILVIFADLTSIRHDWSNKKMGISLFEMIFPFMGYVEMAGCSGSLKNSTQAEPRPEKVLKRPGKKFTSIFEPVKSAFFLVRSHIFWFWNRTTESSNISISRFLRCEALPVSMPFRNGEQCHNFLPFRMVYDSLG